jgi:hypothetical protein
MCNILTVAATLFEARVSSQLMFQAHQPIQNPIPLLDIIFIPHLQPVRSQEVGHVSLVLYDKLVLAKLSRWLVAGIGVGALVACAGRGSTSGDAGQRVMQAFEGEASLSFGTGWDYIEIERRWDRKCQHNGRSSDLPLRRLIATIGCVYSATITLSNPSVN